MQNVEQSKKRQKKHHDKTDVISYTVRSNFIMANEGLYNIKVGIRTNQTFP